MDTGNPAFTGLFDTDFKRIDLILVIPDGSNIETELIINLLSHILKFGLELELVEGELFEHKHLIFVKVHAPDSIIEKYGVYFNIRKFFKDSHLHHNINSALNPFGVRQEREAIELVREQYPGPQNYSTLERSKIVYNIIDRLPFIQQHEYIFGINLLVKYNIILDAFALHDGPYFLASGQKTCINARQALFYNWVGIGNIWKMQPLHMIQEYLGDSVAMYFAYYEYFVLMLIPLSIAGFIHILVSVKWEDLSILNEPICMRDELAVQLHVCPQCRHAEICMSRRLYSYCKEIMFISKLDTIYMLAYGLFASVWGIIFATLWERRQYYLVWMWEIKEKYMENITNPDYSGILQISRKCHISNLTGVIWNEMVSSKLRCVLINLLCAALFSVWLFGLFVLSIHAWYTKHWIMSYSFENLAHQFHVESEYVYIALAAIGYSIVTMTMKIIAKIIIHKLTAHENYKTTGSYSCALALKLYAFYFTATFAYLTFHTIIVQGIFYTGFMVESNYFSLGGYKVMNNGYGTSLDDMCIILAVAVAVEQIIVKIPSYVKSKTSDYQCIINKKINIPCWEREYKLDTLKDGYFHNEYNEIAIQFGVATLFSMVFSLAPFVILITSIIDIRCKAKALLLTYRRPLLLNTSGPGIWHKIILITSFILPICVYGVIGLQSRRILMGHIRKSFYQPVYMDIENGISIESYQVKYYDLYCFPAIYNQLFNMTKIEPFCDILVYTGFIPTSTPCLFKPSHEFLFAWYYRSQYIIAYSVIGILFNLFIYFKWPQSDDIDEALSTEWRIKQKHYIENGYTIDMD